MRRRSAFEIALAAIAWFALGPAGRALAAGEPPWLELRVRLKVAVCDEDPVRGAAWIARHVAATNAVFAAQRVRIKPVLERFTPVRCELVTRTHRHAMAKYVPKEGVTVLVMKRVQDVDVPSYNLMGVHWRYRGRAARLAGRHWVFLTSRAVPPTLAHELAHYLGLPHDRAGGNLMTPGPSDPAWRKPAGKRPKPFAPRLNAAQGRRLRESVVGLRDDQ